MGPLRTGRVKRERGRGAEREKDTGNTRPGFAIKPGSLQGVSHPCPTGGAEPPCVTPEIPKSLLENPRRFQGADLGQSGGEFLQEAGLLLRLLPEQGALCLGRGDVLAQASVHQLQAGQLLLQPLHRLPSAPQVPLELADISDARLVLWWDERVSGLVCERMNGWLN